MEEKIKQFIAKEIAPLLAADNGKVEVVSFIPESGILNLKLSGACAHCPMSTITLKYTIEKMLQEQFSEIKQVNNVAS